MENNEKKLQPWFLHIDLDAFFASVEQLDNPSYRGKPVIVGGRKDDSRGVVSTASYEARKFGVHSAMPIFQARRLCPEGIFVPGRMDRYAELSYKIMNIFKDFSPDVEQMSIDEAFIDLTGTEQLFGPPEETAIQVKQKVLEYTGLTVSVGLAQTKYLAKIASGYSKPDGFYFIKPGQEKDFMLSLPLKKLWGVGPKALERLKKAGITTTRDIYEKPLDLLTFLFGNTMGKFLYNVVRGEEKETFSKKRKSHSISAETTFSEDITDIYTAETALMELAHGVMFRLLKEDKYSRTITVKIKYDDFTSVTIQKTFDRNIITLDNFFDNIKKLFEEKYEIGRGIRLLGVGFDKVENEDKPFQQSLFEEKEDKKQAVEKAILNLNKKHPEIKIQKARLLKLIAFIFLFIGQIISISPLKKVIKGLYAKENSVSVQGSGTLLPDNFSSTPSNLNSNSNNSIFNWDINDKNHVEFNINGSWQGEFSGNFLSNFGKNTTFTFEPNIPIFKQDIELSSLFKLNNTWYFEGNFADNFDNNTIALGYDGPENKYFRSFRLSNRNITMPDFYSANTLGYGLSGGKNQAPGFSAHWQSPLNKWSSHVVFRYDMTMPKTATFYGMNLENKKNIKPENYLYGYSFTFPEDAINNLLEIKEIYIEKSDGKYTDLLGKKYKKLSKSDYYYSKQNNILYLSTNAGGNRENNSIPTILITFLSKNSADEIITKTGKYTDKKTFAGQIQELFNSSGRNFNLNDYKYELKSTIENDPALVIQNSQGFSPFIIANTYDCGTNLNTTVSVVSKSAEKKLDSYVTEIINNSYTDENEDFFNLKHLYATIKNKKIINNKTYQFPFASTFPEIYLNIKDFSDIAIQLKSLTSISEINIGQHASAGTIQVYKNGVNELDFIYNTNTGTITLSTPIQSTDTIKIIWQEEASNYAKGAFTLGAGFSMNILPELFWDISITAQKPVNFNEDYYTLDNIQNSFIALSTGLNYTKNNFTIYDKAAFSIQKQNDKNKLLVSTQNNYIPKNYSQKRDSGKDTLITPEIENYTLYKESNYTIKDYSPIEDKDIKDIKIPLQWNYADADKGNILGAPWASLDLILEGGKDLKNCSSLQVLIQLKDNLPLKSHQLFLQLGNKASNNNQYKENTVQTFNITNQIDFTSTKWQTITIDLSDVNRSFLTENYDLRFVVISNIEKSIENKGTIYIGPYKTILQSIYATSDENIILTTSSVPMNDNSFSSKITWNNFQNSEENHIITAKTNFSPADFSQYKKINFNFAYEILGEKTLSENLIKSPALTFTLSTPSGTNTLSEENTAIELQLKNITPYISSQIKYHTVSIILDEQKVTIDGNVISPSLYELKINKQIAPSTAKYEISTNINSKQIANGSFYINNITYEQSDITIGGQNVINASYKKDKILNINNTPILSNGFIETTSNQKFTKNKVTVISSFKGGINIANILFNGDFLIQQENFVNAGHSLKTSKPLFNIFDYTEEYRWNKNEYSLNKNNNFNLTLSPYKIPLTINSSLKAEENKIIKNQIHKTELTTNLNFKNNNFIYKTSLETNQTINLIQNPQEIKNNNHYFNSWLNITSFQFSIGAPLASTRKSNLKNKIALSINNDFIIPELQFNLFGTYENINKTELNHTGNIILNIPITLKNHFISFNINKTAGNIENISSGGNYFTDLSNIFSYQNKNKYLYTSIPFYELFDTNINNKINGNYSTKYEIIYKKKLFNSIYDLFIPSSCNFTVMRNVNSNSKLNDTYQLKTVITNTSLNNFGKNSDLHLFNWFDQEEIISSITGIVKIPTDKPENTSYLISGYLQLLFMLNNNSTLQSAFDFSVETGNNWTTGGTFVYKRPGKTCLMSAIAGLFSQKAKETHFSISRKDSLNYKIATINKINKQEYTYNHSVEMDFLNYFTISTAMGGTFTYLQNAPLSLAINYSLGGKVSF